MSSPLKPDYSSIIDREFEAAGHIWTTKADFDENNSTTADQFLATIKFENGAGDTRLLEMTLSRAAVRNDVYGKYHVGVIAVIQDWLWGQDRSGHIRFMGV